VAGNRSPDLLHDVSVERVSVVFTSSSPVVLISITTEIRSTRRESQRADARRLTTAGSRAEARLFRSYAKSISGPEDEAKHGTLGAAQLDDSIGEKTLVPMALTIVPKRTATASVPVGTKPETSSDGSSCSTAQSRG
jgi:hypothetical protein